jgi:hypothetical protein
MLVEIDGALFAEARASASPRREPSGRRQRRQPWAVWAGMFGSLAAACLIAVLAWPKRDGNDTIPSPVTNERPQHISSQPPEGPTDLAALLALRRNLTETDVPAFAWPVENAVSISSPLDLAD